MSGFYISRRKFLTLTGVGAGGLALAGCDAWSEPGTVTHDFLDNVERFTEAAQRLVITDQTMAREFSEAEISPFFRPNGSTAVRTDEYRAVSFAGFRDYRLQVTGLVQQPLSLSLDELRAMPARTQITRHDCVEGWSCIGKWTGPQLATVLAMAGLQPEARYVVFRCFDSLDHSRMGRVEYYESIGMEDALHPQTILAYDMNDRALPIPYGAPLRLRVERQLGYKMAKYIRSIEIVASFAEIRGGRGGYYEDGNSYEWYAGI
jgi:DMSO/TMAO reductase YedYZ molybdopterin-dependent catalytic subunit